MSPTIPASPDWLDAIQARKDRHLALAAGRFPTWLRNYRQTLSLTQDQLAAAINAKGGNVINGSVICHWETGSRRPNGMNLIALCIAMEVSIVDAQQVLMAEHEEPLTSDNQPG